MTQRVCLFVRSPARRASRKLLERIVEFIRLLDCGNQICEYNQEQCRVTALNGKTSLIRSFPSKVSVSIQSAASNPRPTACKGTGTQTQTHTHTHAPPCFPDRDAKRRWSFYLYCHESSSSLCFRIPINASSDISVSASSASIQTRSALANASRARFPSDTHTGDRRNAFPTTTSSIGR